MAYVLGLTGSIACGKTTVGLMLLELGAAAYCDADAVVHDLYLPGRPLVGAIAEAFGPTVVDAEGGVDRKALGQIVFGNREHMQRLEALVHPFVRAALLDQLRHMPDEGVGVLDAVKLVESGYAQLCAGVWVVTCPEDEQYRRLRENRGLSEREARSRLAAQPPMQPKLAAASEVIANANDLSALHAQVAAAWERFNASIRA